MTSFTDYANLRRFLLANRGGSVRKPKAKMAGTEQGQNNAAPGDFAPAAADEFHHRPERQAGSETVGDALFRGMHRAARPKAMQGGDAGVPGINRPAAGASWCGWAAWLLVPPAAV